MNIDFARIALHGGALALAASALVMGTLRLNPRLFLRHFPAAVKASQPPLSNSEKLAGRIVGGALILLLFGVPIWSARVAAVDRTYGGFEIFAHAFLVAIVFNAVDWLVLDELWLGVGRPRWVLPPGVSPEDVPFDHAQHARGFVTGTVLCAVIGVVASLMV